MGTEKREIKFRAWDGLNMWYEGGNGDYFLTRCDLLNRPDVEVMQFTGMKDSNGKEIYEGDVVCVPGWDPPIYQIRFIEGEFTMAWWTEDRSGLMKHGEYIGDIRYATKGCVIGHIHENWG